MIFEGVLVSRERGLTLLEILMVLLLLGILVVVTIPDMVHAVSQFKVDDVTRRVVADIRYAQALAVRSGTSAEVIFDAGNENYTLEKSGATAQNPLTKADFIVDLTLEGVDLSLADFSGDQDLIFDSLGAPLSGGTVVIRYGNYQRTIEVLASTGRVRVQ